MRYTLTLVLSVLTLLLYSCSQRKPVLTGDWQLEKVEGLYPTGFKPKDAVAQILYAATDSASRVALTDSLPPAAPEVSEVWSRYFERFNIGWYVIEPDTHRLCWTFTDQYDSELRIYDDSGHVATRLASYWSRSDSTIVFTGFFGWYQQCITFRIVSLTSTALVLQLHTPYAALGPQLLYFCRISDQPGADTHLIGIRFEDVQTTIGPVNVFVRKENQHPFLADHDRRLVVATADGHIIDSRRLQSDPGEGCPAFLFDAAHDLLLADCNDAYYHISKSEGNIHQIEWRWEETPRDKYLGTYRRGRGADYDLIYDSAFASDMHRVKDPPF